MPKTTICILVLLALFLAQTATAQGILEVREGGASGTPISDNEPTGGLRDFGQLPVSTNSGPLTFYFSNVGSSPITFGAYSKTGADPTHFYVTDWTGFTNPLPIGQTTSLTIVFHSQTASANTATLNLPHDATGSGSSPFQINMKAEAVLSPHIQVTLVPGVYIPHNGSPVGSARDFGNQDTTAGPSPVISIEIKNTGSSTLTFPLPDTGGLGSNDFVLDTTGTTLSLPPGQTTTFDIAFDPTSAGVKDAVVRIFHNNGFQPSPFLVPVTGVGTSTPTDSDDATDDDEKEVCTTSEDSGATLQFLAMCCAIACLVRLRKRREHRHNTAM